MSTIFINLLIFFWLCTILICDAEISFNRCTSRVSCSDCISTPSCSWCLEPHYNKPRCFERESFDNTGCAEEYTYAPINKFTIKKDLKPISSSAENIQFSPQEVGLTLRVDEPYTIPLRYTVNDLQTQHFELTHNATGDLEITYQTKCPKENVLALNNYCRNLIIGEAVEFLVTLRLRKCRKSVINPTQVIERFPKSDFTKNKLLITVTTVCSCPCEDANDLSFEVNSPVCHFGGTRKCGICDCNKDRFGQFCECRAYDTTNGGCRPENASPLGFECSGRGTCICGQCECNMRPNIEEVISGKYCECDNYSCPRNNGEICGGPHRGICECGICVCKSPSYGNDCSLNTQNA